MSETRETPERIWLQDDWDPEFGQTWCDQQVNDTDTSYVRADLFDALTRDRDAAEARGRAAGLREALAEVAFYEDVEITTPKRDGTPKARFTAHEVGVHVRGAARDMLKRIAALLPPPETESPHAE